MTRLRYTTEQLAFLKNGYKEMQIKQLTTAFNASFSLNKTASQIKATLKNHGFTCGRKGGHEKGHSVLFTTEQIDFIRRMYRHHSLKELTVIFNKQFNSNRLESQIRSYIHNNGINSGRTGRFDKGHVPWSAGKKGVMKPNSGSFKKGQVPATVKPIGSERICPKDGYLLVKIAEQNPYTGHKTRYKAKHIVVWEKANGKIPEGHVLMFLDGDKLNCSLKNLICISRQEQLLLNRHGFTELPMELKPTMLATVKVQARVFGIQAGEKS